MHGSAEQGCCCHLITEALSRCQAPIQHNFQAIWEAGDVKRARRRCWRNEANRERRRRFQPGAKGACALCAGVGFQKPPDQRCAALPAGRRQVQQNGGLWSAKGLASQYSITGKWLKQSGSRRFTGPQNCQSNVGGAGPGRESARPIGIVHSVSHHTLCSVQQPRHRGSRCRWRQHRRRAAAAAGLRRLLLLGALPSIVLCCRCHGLHRVAQCRAQAIKVSRQPGVRKAYENTPLPSALRCQLRGTAHCRTEMHCTGTQASMHSTLAGCCAAPHLGVLHVEQVQGGGAPVPQAHLPPPRRTHLRPVDNTRKCIREFRDIT